MPGTVQVLCGLINEDITKAVAPTLGLILEKWVGRCEAGVEPGSRGGKPAGGSRQGCLMLTAQLA